MDWTALNVSLQLGFWTVLLACPLGLALARLLAYRRFPGRRIVEATLAMPLVLPPTVIGYYLLATFGRDAAPGRLWESLTGHPLAFTFEGLVAASIIANIPFAIQPVQRAFEAIPREVREAAACSGMTPWTAFWRIDLPLAWPGIVTALVFVFAHTLGEFGVVLMVGGNIPGATQTLSIAIYDRVQAFDDAAAGQMALFLLAFSFLAIAAILTLSERIGRRHG